MRRLNPEFKFEWADVPWVTVAIGILAVAVAMNGCVDVPATTTASTTYVEPAPVVAYDPAYVAPYFGPEVSIYHQPEYNAYRRPYVRPYYHTYRHSYYRSGHRGHRH